MDAINRLIRLVTRTPLDFETLCNKLGQSPKKVRALIRDARGAGYAVDVAGETVALRPAIASDDIALIRLPPQKPGTPHTFSVCSDLHFGSKYHLRAELLDFIERSYAKGVRLILLPGDLLDGCYRHGRWELTHHGFQDQAGDFLAHLPQYPGLIYKGITGNHDETFEKETGLVVHTTLNQMAISAGRRDFELLGARGAFLRLRSPGERRGAIVELWHPLKGPAYALTYGMQKHIESYAPGKKPDFLFTGHWHQSAYFMCRAVNAFSSGTFQGGGSSFGKALGGAPSIGGWTVQYALTKDGTVRDVSPTWTSYYEGEAPREFRI